jgi:hypothetical protein
MAENIYAQIGKRVGKDARLVRAVARHPFEFFSKIMTDPQDHRAFRFRYLGVFFVKPYWHKGLRNTTKVGLPPENTNIYARVPELRFNKVYINLKKGKVENGIFNADDNSVICPVDEIRFWVEIQ